MQHNVHGLAQGHADRSSLPRKALIIAVLTAVGILRINDAALAQSPAHPPETCAIHIPYGMPQPVGHTQPICHTGYIAFVDLDLLVPRIVAYRLRAPASGHCFPRKNNFHPDPALPSEHRASPADYEGSGYDQGHQAPAEDFAGDAAEMSDSFSMANMAPQAPGLNRQGWERIEEDVRGWTLARGELEVYVGPALGGATQTIGVDHVIVPTAFWKVVIDSKTHEALAFVLPNAPVKKTDAPNFHTTIAATEAAAGFNLALPAGIDRTTKPVLWKEGPSEWCSSQ